jgi:hypothetical protein
MISIPLAKDQWDYLIRLLVEQKYRDSAVLIETIARGMHQATITPDARPAPGSTEQPADAAAA